MNERKQSVRQKYKWPCAAGIAPTPQQTEGPFYPVAFPSDIDNDLVQVRGRFNAFRALVHFDELPELAG